MAALCPGVKYGLSSQGNVGENKDLIFVKLTDSAYRAIEEYLKKQSKFSQRPTIQFLGNEGHLSFPSDHGSANTNGCASFSFSVSSTADMEGPGGSFECFQQPARNASAVCEVLGAMPHKIRVHANDDVYEATRHRMTVAEENHKNKCTRVIKPNQTDIGRKVKVKQTPGRSIPIPKRSESPHLTTTTTNNNNGVHHHNNNNNNNNNNHHLNNNNNNSSSQTVAKPLLPSSKPVPVPQLYANGNSNVSNTRQQPPSNRHSNDIMRRPMKERLIHLLALRPYKKPELIEQVNKDSREKNMLTTVLKQIAFMHDNTYHLRQHMWNDVHDNWPYYTDEERQLLKRRKPQNLTPPGSSDGGSSGSGQSPTSTHPGSPPSLTTTTPSVKRPGYYDGADGLPTKRPRISHYRKPERPVDTGARRPVTDSRDASNMNPRSREVQQQQQQQQQQRFNDEEPPPPPPPNSANQCDSPSLSYAVQRSDNKNSIGSGKKQQQQPPPPTTNVAAAAAEQNRWKVTSTTIATSPDSQEERLLEVEVAKAMKPSPKPVQAKLEFPDYLTEYTTIKNTEQRRRYKAHFNADYTEYRNLHAVVEKVSRRFAQLEERLKQEDKSSPGYKEIRRQIVRDYNENQRDVEYQETKRRFQYLHDKLSHIKRLVLEYDQPSTSSELRSQDNGLRY